MSDFDFSVSDGDDEYVQLPSILCPVCRQRQTATKVFLTNTKLLRHVRRRHPEEADSFSYKRKACRICEVRLPSFSLMGLLNHVIACPDLSVSSGQERSPACPEFSSLIEEVKDYAHQNPGSSSRLRCPSFLCTFNDPNVKRPCRECEESIRELALMEEDWGTEREEEQGGLHSGNVQGSNGKSQPRLLWRPPMDLWKEVKTKIIAGELHDLQRLLEKLKKEFAARREKKRSREPKFNFFSQHAATSH